MYDIFFLIQKKNDNLEIAWNNMAGLFLSQMGFKMM